MLQALGLVFQRGKPGVAPQQVWPHCGASRGRSSPGGVCWAQGKVTLSLGFSPVPSDLCAEVPRKGLRADWLTGPGPLSEVLALPYRSLGQCGGPVCAASAFLLCREPFTGTMEPSVCPHTRKELTRIECWHKPSWSLTSEVGLCPLYRRGHGGAKLKRLQRNKRPCQSWGCLSLLGAHETLPLCSLLPPAPSNFASVAAWWQAG